MLINHKDFNSLGRLSLKTLLFFLAIASFSACGGGSGGGNSKGNNGVGESCRANQCDTLGLDFKVTDGVECSKQSSPVVQISIAPTGDFADVCTGTLLTANAVLTAAHCLPGSADGVFVIHENERIAAKAVISHPKYSVDEAKQLVFNDVGIIILSTPVVSPTVPILISKLPAVGEKFSVFGFGLNESGVSGTLRSGQLEINDVLPTHFSAKFEKGCSNTCGGDSGGPAIQYAINGSGDAVPAIEGILSSGTDRLCREGDVSKYLYLNNPEVLGFILDNVPGAGLI